MAPTDKQQNVVKMLKGFGEMLQKMPEGKLREEFSSFVFQLTFGNRTLPQMLDWIESKIAEASSVQHQDLQVNAKSTVKFWETIRDTIITTYKENKEL